MERRRELVRGGYSKALAVPGRASAGRVAVATSSSSSSAAAASNRTGEKKVGRDRSRGGSRMVDWVSGSDEEFSWDSDGDGQVVGTLDGAGTSGAASSNLDAPGPSTLTYVEMGFEKNMVLKAMEENGDGDAESLVLLLLNYKAMANENGCSISACAPGTVVDMHDDDDILENWDDEDSGGNNDEVDDSDDEELRDFLQELSQRDIALESLVKMGFPEDEVQMAITRCGHDAPISVLVDSICASETAGDGGNSSQHEDNSYGRRKKKTFMKENRRKRKRFGGEVQGRRGAVDDNNDELMPLPKPMVGFGLPTERSGLPNPRWRSLHERVPAQAVGPPYFYYENVALAPRGVWATISRFLYDIAPEFVDSKYFCAAARKRGYIHNLPIENRSALLPVPPKTIFEAFPRTKKWWPSWDPRRQLNCLQTCMASAPLVERIRVALTNDGDPPSLTTQKYVLEQCRQWNLIWVGRNKVAHLEPHEIEFLLGFPMDHTRGMCRTDRFKALGNSFQVDTVAYHLSVLKDMFPQGMNVLSLFSGIGGAEVALDKLGVHMKTVISVEKSEKNRTVLKSWWDQTQTGTLIEINDVESLTSKRIEAYIERYGGFDLIIGGSPCNNLAGSNRHHRDGLKGEHSSLFYHYFRILEVVKFTMGRMSGNV